MQTVRDGEIAAWIGWLGAAGVEHVVERFDMSRSQAYSRLSWMKHAGLVEHKRLLHLRPGLYIATRRGLQWQGLSRLRMFRLSPGGFEHMWRIAGAAAALHCKMQGWEMLGERQFRVLEADEGKLIATAQIGWSDSRPMLHRPDLALIPESGRAAVLEVELSTKSPVHLEKICRGWTSARHVGHVYYLAAPSAKRAVSRAVARTKTFDLITVLDLEDVAGLAERELAREREPRCEPAIERPAPEPESQDLWQFPQDDTVKRANGEAENVLGA